MFHQFGSLTCDLEDKQKEEAISRSLWGLSAR